VVFACPTPDDVKVKALGRVGNHQCHPLFQVRLVLV
jgi:hypothetical protein